MYDGQLTGAQFIAIELTVGSLKEQLSHSLKPAILVYRVLRGDLIYLDPGADAYLQIQCTRLINTLSRRAKEVGLRLY